MPTCLNTAQSYKTEKPAISTNRCLGQREWYHSNGRNVLHHPS